MVTRINKKSAFQRKKTADNTASINKQTHQLQDDRPEHIAQQKIQNFISNGSLMVAQRQTIKNIFSPVVQREPTPELEEEKLPLAQPKFKDSGNQTGDTPAQPKAENNTGLPDTLKSGIENLSGVSMDDVKVHYGSSKPAQLNALAYAQGTDIHVAPGQEQHLPHEAWHVVQQKEGRVEPTLQMNDVSINDDASLESEADVMGQKAMNG
jgi:hypothetical protein